MSAPVWRIDVVVPARDEADHVGACVDALLAARAELAATRPDVACGITLVLDACVDDTGAVARRHLGDAPDHAVLEVRSGSVGRARARGVASALGQPGPDDEHRWIANTDADSRVEPGWLVQQADALRDGVEVLVGAVVPDPADLEPDVLRRWQAAHPPGVVLGHTHGANLGVRADVYRAVGGFTLVPEHEDVTLVDQARASGRRVEPTGDLAVVTSGRTVGRTPGGYARHLLETYRPTDADRSAST